MAKSSCAAPALPPRSTMSAMSRAAWRLSVCACAARILAQASGSFSRRLAARTISSRPQACTDSPRSEKNAALRVSHPGMGSVWMSGTPKTAASEPGHLLREGQGAHAAAFPVARAELLAQARVVPRQHDDAHVRRDAAERLGQGQHVPKAHGPGHQQQDAPLLRKAQGAPRSLALLPL